MHTVQMSDGQSENMQVELSEALGQDGQLIITNEDGNGRVHKFDKQELLKEVLMRFFNIILRVLQSFQSASVA